MIKLTERETTILHLISQGYFNSEIGKKINISVHTVKAHISTIIRKLDARNRSHAIYIAMKNHLVE